MAVEFHPARLATLAGTGAEHYPVGMSLSVFDPASVLADLTGWSVAPGHRPAIQRKLSFPDFNAAFAFMTRVAIKAETLDHHPEWSNVYNRVEVLLTTHDAGGVTENDMRLARFIDEAAKSLGGK